MEDTKTGTTYCVSVTLTKANKTAKSKRITSDHNPKDISENQFWYPYYHPIFCCFNGYITSSSPFFIQKKVLIEQQKLNLARIQMMKIKEEVLVQDNGKSNMYESFIALLCTKLSYLL